MRSPSEPCSMHTTFADKDKRPSPKWQRGSAGADVQSILSPALHTWYLTDQPYTLMYFEPDPWQPRLRRPNAPVTPGTAQCVLVRACAALHVPTAARAGRLCESLRGAAIDGVAVHRRLGAGLRVAGPVQLQGLELGVHLHAHPPQCCCLPTERLPRAGGQCRSGKPTQHIRATNPKKYSHRTGRSMAAWRRAGAQRTWSTLCALWYASSAS